MVVGRQFYIFRAITEKLRSPNLELNDGTISFNVWPWWVYMSWIYIGASPNNDLWDSSNIFNTILFITSSQWRLVRTSSRWLCLYFYYFYLYIISIVIFYYILHKDIYFPGMSNSWQCRALLSVLVKATVWLTKSWLYNIWPIQLHGHSMPNFIFYHNRYLWI